MSGAAAALTTIGLILLALAVGGACARLLPRAATPRRRAPAAGLPLVAVGLALRLGVEVVHVPGGLALLVASYGLLIGACLLNLARPGASLVALGLLVMLAPTVVDGGMPVRPSALSAMGIDANAPALPGERHVEVERDQVPVLGELVPLPLGGRPTSFGELIALVGLADLAFNAGWPSATGARRRTGRRRGPHVDCPIDSDLIVVEPPPGEDEPPTVVLLGAAPGRSAAAGRIDGARADHRGIDGAGIDVRTDHRGIDSTADPRPATASSAVGSAADRRIEDVR
jgi:hypothetical protein